MSVLKIHMTYQCSAECAHCRFQCMRRPAPAIDFDLAMRTVRTLKDANGLELVILMGGEPGLFADLTHRLTAATAALGLNVRIETNGFWAASPIPAHGFLEPLYAAGASVMLSLDAFHEPFVSPDCVERAIRASDELGGNYCIDTAYIDPDNPTDPFDQRTNELLADMERRLGRPPCTQPYKGGVLFSGRAARDLAPRVATGRGVPDGICRAVPWWADSKLDTFDLLILDPDGYLSKGCGIAIGNVATDGVRHILDTFDAHRHPIFSTLLTEGPLGLAREAEPLGYEMRTDYADKCHLCQEAREVLRTKYPDILTPAQHYGDPDMD